MNVPPLKCPGFFCFYMPESNNEELKIPSGFVQDIKEAWPKNVSLRDRYGNSWRVNVRKVGNIWYFKDGWKKFVEDSSLNSEDALTFKYIGRGVFYVKMFGRNACEKKQPSNTCQKKKASNTCQKKKASNTCSKDRNTEEQRYKVVEDDEDEDEQVKDEDEEDDGQKDQLVEPGRDNIRTQRRRKSITDWLGMELFRSGRVRRPTNPYFVTKSKLLLHKFPIPKAVAEFHNIELPDHITLVDENGREFLIDRKIWGKRMYYCGDWRFFYRLNLLQREDKCVCEFIHGDDGELYLHTSIIRANRQQERRRKEEKSSVSSRRIEINPKSTSSYQMDDVLDVVNVKDKLNWSTKEEEYLITLMVEEVKKGSLNPTNFQKRTWTVIANKLQRKFDKVYTLAKLRQKFNQLKTKWKLFKELIGSTGIGWDHVKNTVVATDDEWNKKFAVNKDFKQFRKRGCDHYDLLTEIFAETIATGGLARSSTQGLLNSDEEQEVEEVFLNGTPTDVDDDLYETDPSPSIKKSRKKRKFHVEGYSRNKSKYGESTFVDEAYIAFKDAQVEKNILYDKASGTSRSKEEECVGILNTMDGITSEKYMKAISKFEGASTRLLFLSMPEARQKEWVESL